MNNRINSNSYITRNKQRQKATSKQQQLNPKWKSELMKRLRYIPRG